MQEADLVVQKVEVSFAPLFYVEIVVVHDLESESIFVNPPKLKSDSLSFRAAQTITFHCKNTVAFRNPRVRTSPIFLKTSF